MKTRIHPTWYPESQVSCVCGNAFTTGSTQPTIRVELCSACHPFYTGQQKFVDTQGQVEKFSKTLETAKAKQAERVKVLEARAARVSKEHTEKPTLKDLLMQARKSAASS